MNLPRIRALSCVALTVVFIFFVTHKAPVSDKAADQIALRLTEVFDTSGLSLRSGGEFRKVFRLSPGEYDGVVYYSSDSVMDVRELLVVRLKDESQSKQLVSVIQKHIEDKIVLFNGYAPEEEALLGSYVLKSSRGIVLFAVCSNPDRVLEAFNQAL